MYEIYLKQLLICTLLKCHKMYIKDNIIREIRNQLLK